MTQLSTCLAILYTCILHSCADTNFLLRSRACSICFIAISVAIKIQWWNEFFLHCSQHCRFVSTVTWSNVPDGDVTYTYLRIAQVTKLAHLSARLALYLKIIVDICTTTVHHMNIPVCHLMSGIRYRYTHNFAIKLTSVSLCDVRPEIGC